MRSCLQCLKCSLFFIGRCCNTRNNNNMVHWWCNAVLNFVGPLFSVWSHHILLGRSLGAHEKWTGGGGDGSKSTDQTPAVGLNENLHLNYEATNDSWRQSVQLYGSAVNSRGSSRPTSDSNCGSQVCSIIDIQFGEKHLMAVCLLQQRTSQRLQREQGLQRCCSGRDSGKARLTVRCAGFAAESVLQNKQRQRVPEEPVEASIHFNSSPRPTEGSKQWGRQHCQRMYQVHFQWSLCSRQCCVRSLVKEHERMKNNKKRKSEQEKREY